MKMNRIIFAAAAVALAASCVPTPEIEFGIDTDKIEIGPAGGQKKINVSSSGNWVAMTESPWITVSPANGRGSVECSISIDSALVAEPRTGTVRIHNLDTDENMDFSILQEGFEYQIVPNKSQVNVDDFAAYESRFFEVKVKSNVDFDVVLPEGAENWLSYKKSDINLDRGARPREVEVRFKWNTNFNPNSRDAVISFNPVNPDQIPAVKDDLNIKQEAAEEIEIGVKGDSLALIAINRALGCWTECDTSEKLEFWDGVELWQSGENKGRVKKAEFFMFGTKEGIPFQVKYLTAADELYFFSNTNTFLYSLDPGEHICELTQLRKLTIGSYGLTTLPDSFKKLKNLEYLDLSSNNFQSVPEVLTPENFPKLTALILNACQRQTIYDLSNTNKTNYGGLCEEVDEDADGNKFFPKRFLRWDKLDTLRLSVNYLEGRIPDLKNDPEFPKWTAEEVHACDTLPEVLIGLPKVLPETDFFAINLNRLYGDLPDWLLYHPKLDLWYPTSLVFFQEGIASDGTAVGFSNEPANMDYYYEHYVNKKYNPSKIGSEE